MSKRISKLQRAKNLVNKGYSNKYIFEHFPNLPKHTVYNARWMLNKEKGLASLPKPDPVATGTGITSAAPLTFEIIDHPNDKRVVKASNKRRNAQLKRWAREREEKRRQDLKDMYALNAYSPMEYPIPARLTKPTLWQKIKAFFVGA